MKSLQLQRNSVQLQPCLKRPFYADPVFITWEYPAMHVLPETGYLRLRDIIGRPATKTDPGIPALIPVSASTWWKGVKEHRYPQPTRALGRRITAWTVDSIRELIDATAPKAAP
jgi:predicted DNA-binding transcriptional regulator AlpA